MAQHDFDLANQAGAGFRSDLNAALQALVTLSSGTSAPSTTFAGQWWHDTTAGLLKLRNAANSAWLTIGPFASLMPRRGYISGLIPSTAGSSATMTISAGEATDDANTCVMRLASAISKTTSAWAVGSGNGGLDTGSIANSTPYYFWEIMREDTGVVDVLISLSATAPTMPANYTLKRLIAWGKTDGSGQWESFKAYETAGGGYKHIWAAPTIELNSTSVTTARTTTTPVGLPAGFSTEAHLEYAALNSSGTCSVHIASPDETDAAPTSTGITVLPLAAGTTYAGAKVVQTSSTGTIAVRSTAANTTVILYCDAFEWSRR
jgi:hypothetical protein